MAADYKAKYLDIRSKLIEASDVAYRLGFEEGMKEGQQAAQQQQQEQEMMMQQQAQEAAMGGAEGGMPAEMGGEEMPAEMGGEEMGEEEGSELDDHISELEGMVAKGSKPKVSDLRNAVLTITKLRKTQKDNFQKKNEKIISKQKNVVDGILKKWENESSSVSSNLENIIKEHGIDTEE